MANAHDVVTLPKYGRGSHPLNQSLALDGRTKNILAAKNLLDLEEHRGSFYWVVTNTSEQKEGQLGCGHDHLDTVDTNVLASS